MIIDASYFKKGYLYIPNAEDINPSSSSTKENEDLTFFVKKYERELLVNALGLTLYNELKALQTPYLGKWKGLIDGESYTVDDNSYRWDGLKGFNGNSLVANYIYCKWIRNDESVYTTTGVVQNTAKNARSFSLTPKYIKVWNEFIAQYQGNKTNTYPKIINNHYGDIGLDFYDAKESAFRSLCEYIKDKNKMDSSLFPDAPLRLYELQNSFGI